MIAFLGSLLQCIGQKFCYELYSSSYFLVYLFLFCVSIRLSLNLLFI